MEQRIPKPDLGPRRHALQVCMAEAMAEAPGLASRWVAALSDVLKQRDAWSANPSEKAGLANAIRVLTQHKNRFESEWVAHWGRAITDALQRQSDGPVVRRSLAHLKFDELELMDDSQIQATVQVARLEQVVQGAAGDALTELSALLSRAQGFAVVKADHNPLRPDVAIAVLRQTMEAITTDKAVRNLWLQQGTPILGQELQVLYRHLVRVLETHGITPVGFNVVQAPGGTVGKTGGAQLRQRPDGVADRLMADADGGWVAESLPVPVASPDLLTLNHLHQLLVADSQGASPSGRQPTPQAAVLPPSDPWNTMAPRSLPPLPTASQDVADFPVLPELHEFAASLSNAAPVAESPGGADGTRKPYTGPDRRARRATDLPSRDEAALHLKALASEVVHLMLDGMARDTRLLPPVRDVLQRLEPALLRIAHEDPRFFADKLNPARQLLDEVTQRSLAFDSDSAPGLARFLATLDDVVQLFLQTSVAVSKLFETALEVLAPEEPLSGHAPHNQARDHAVATLVKAEQRFLLAEKVAQEVARRPDFTKADPLVQRFVQGPWAQVIAQARLEPAARVPPGRLSPDLRYLGVLSDLLWSSCVEASRRNRGRLARLIPGLLRTLREGLQTIDYDAVASRRFFTAIMALHEAGLKSEAQSSPSERPSPLLVLPPIPDSVEPLLSRQPEGLWMRPSEAADTGFMAEPFPELMLDDFADTQPQFDVAAESAPAPGIPELSAGAWVSLLSDEGQWQRMQLTWSSPHGTMYLFNGPDGRTTSMTRRGFEKLWPSGRLKLVAAHSVVDDALDSVLDMAVLNSARTPAPPGEDTVYPDLLPPLT